VHEIQSYHGGEDFDVGFWAVTPYGLIGRQRRFGGIYCLHYPKYNYISYGSILIFIDILFLALPSTMLCEISSSHGGNYEDKSLLRYSAV
jgi:hypothetical protein